MNDFGTFARRCLLICSVACASLAYRAHELGEPVIALFSVWWGVFGILGWYTIASRDGLFDSDEPPLSDDCGGSA